MFGCKKRKNVNTDSPMKLGNVTSLAIHENFYQNCLKCQSVLERILILNVHLQSKDKKLFASESFEGC